MTSLGLTIVLYALLLAVLFAGVAVAGRQRPAAATLGVAVLEVAALVQAGADLLDLVRGRRGGEVAAHIGYLLASLLVLPGAVAAVRLDPGRWGSAALAIGTLVFAVVSIRLHQTLGAAPHA